MRPGEYPKVSAETAGRLQDNSQIRSWRSCPRRGIFSAAVTSIRKTEEGYHLPLPGDRVHPQCDKHILAIDLGTSGPKVALVSTDGEIVASEFEETPLLLLADGGAEQRPDDWWTAVTTATRRLLARNACALEDIAAISCTSQYSSTVAVGSDGRPLMNAVNWMDTRGTPHVRRITGGWPRIQGYGLGKLLTWVRLTGGAPTHSGKDSIAHILYIKAERPDVYRATHKFLEPKDYLNLLLTGECAASYDSINLHWLTDNRDIAHIRYDARLLSLAGIRAEKLPVLKHATNVLGPLTAKAAEQLGLRGLARRRRDDRRPVGRDRFRSCERL